MHNSTTTIVIRATIGLAALTVLLVLASCDRHRDDNTAESAEPVDDIAAISPESDAPPADDDSQADILAASADQLPPDTRGDDASLEALVPSIEIPYPVYPNGSKYRVGGEHGLKIVVFETTDSFEAVDDFYAAQSDAHGMPRLAGMADYVRYGSGLDDADPWATDLPGIVVHKFTDDSERKALGAGKDARTNIIMSY